MLVQTRTTGAVNAVVVGVLTVLEGSLCVFEWPRFHPFSGRNLYSPGKINRPAPTQQFGVHLVHRPEHAGPSGGRPVYSAGGPPSLDHRKPPVVPQEFMLALPWISFSRPD